VAAPPSWRGWVTIAALALASWWLEPRHAANPARRSRRRRSSIPNSPEAQKAAREWQAFHWGREPKSARRMRVPDAPETLVKLGDLESVVYKTRKGSEPVTHYHHEFAEGGGRKPTLAMDPRTRRLHVVGGTYSVGWRGIVG
jgi:hypothetical protein